MESSGGANGVQAGYGALSPGHFPGVSPGTDPELRRLLTHRVYRRRWFILLVLCLLNCSNATVWLSFAPVADQSAQCLQVSVAQINWLSLVFMVAAIPLSLGTSWMLDSLGLRVTLVLGSWLNMLGAVLRVWGVPGGSGLGGVPNPGGSGLGGVPNPGGYHLLFPLVLGGQILGAAAQPLLVFTPTKMAALWFPENQRATANTLASMANPLGILLANVISPLVGRTSDQIPKLMLVYAVPACIACLLATVGVRSSTPPTPPSASAQASSPQPFIQGLRLLVGSRPYLLLLLCLGSGVAVFSCFCSLLQQLLCVQGYSDAFSGLCGALSILGGLLGSLVLGLLVDRTRMFTEAVKVGMSLTGVVSAALSVVAQLPGQQVAVATVCCLFGLFGFSVYPVAMELSVETSYPVGEATAAGLIFISGQVQSVLYMLALQALSRKMADPTRSTCGAVSWRVPLMLMAGICCLSSVLFVVFFQTRYRRMEAEAQAKEDQDQDQDQDQEDQVQEDQVQAQGQEDQVQD